MAEAKGPASTDSAKDAAQSIDARLVRRLADILTATGLTEIEVEHGALRIRVARQVSVQAAPTTFVPAAAPAPAPVAAAPALAVAAAPAAPATPEGEVVKSPMVGTIYLKPAPDAQPFVRVGDKVSAGQTLLIVEAMKTMNPIAAPVAGTVLQVLVGDAQPVEYGEPLVIIG